MQPDKITVRTRQVNNNQGDLYYQQNRLEKIKYNAFKKPFEIEEVGKEKVSFQYNAFKMRSNMFYGSTEDDIYLRNNRKHYSHDGSMEISYDEEQGTTLFVTYIGGDAYSAPAIWRSKQIFGGADDSYYYLHRDYLGSILLITDANGNAKEKRHFDAWGKIVKLTDGNGTNLDKLTFLDRGYTGHEHLQGVKLIHMNGRLYDPNLKRFLAPDNNIQDISNTQNFNRYGYVLNNPLMYVDPSGETFDTPPNGEGSGLSDAQQGLLGGLIASAFTTLEGTDFRGFRNFIGRNFQSAVKDIVRPVREIGRFIRNLFGGSNDESTTIEYGNYNNLTNDPLAGSSNGNTVSTYGPGGSDTGGLGISEGNRQSEINQMNKQFSSFYYQNNQRVIYDKYGTKTGSNTPAITDSYMTDGKYNTYIGEAAFLSEKKLYNVMGHEKVHVGQLMSNLPHNWVKSRNKATGEIYRRDANYEYGAYKWANDKKIANKWALKSIGLYEKMGLRYYNYKNNRTKMSRLYRDLSAYTNYGHYWGIPKN